MGDVLTADTDEAKALRRSNSAVGSLTTTGPLALPGGARSGRGSPELTHRLTMRRLKARSEGDLRQLSAAPSS